MCDVKTAFDILYITVAVMQYTPRYMCTCTILIRMEVNYNDNDLVHCVMIITVKHVMQIVTNIGNYMIWYHILFSI